MSDRPEDAEYAVLVDLVKLEHSRYNDFANVHLAVNTAWLGFLVYLAKNAASDGGSETVSRIMFGGSILGIMLCLLWRHVTARLNIDASRLHWQLRDRERRLPGTGIFLEGDVFFNKGKSLPCAGVSHADANRSDRIEPPKKGDAERFRVKNTAYWLAGIFAAGYMAMLLHAVGVW